MLTLFVYHRKDFVIELAKYVLGDKDDCLTKLDCDPFDNDVFVTIR